jgi:hypothetical protein
VIAAGIRLLTDAILMDASNLKTFASIARMKNRMNTPNKFKGALR